jgi:hypothetical protein
MKTYTIAVNLAVITLLVLLTAIGCTGRQTAGQGTDTSGESHGRVIVPQQTWEPAGGNTSTGQSEAVSGNSGQPADNATPSNTSGSEPGVIETGTIDIKLFVDGIEYASDQAISVFENQQVACEFHVTATGSELKYYTIENPSRYAVKMEGDISGLSVVIPYHFTYISRNWGEGGIRISIENRQGHVETREIDVVEAAMRH